MKLLAELQLLADNHVVASLALPGFGFVDGAIESIEDEMVTIAVEGGKILIHFTNVAICTD